MIYPGPGGEPETPSREHPPPGPLPTDQVEHFRTLLIEEFGVLHGSLERLLGDAIADTPASLGETTARTHLADLGSDSFEQEEDLGLAELASLVMAEIRRALERIDEGAYGVCENCHRPIPLERLEAIPYAALCTQCQSRMEEGVGRSA